jgi:hypothetical protein
MDGFEGLYNRVPWRVFESYREEITRIGTGYDQDFERL